MTKMKSHRNRVWAAIGIVLALIAYGTVCVLNYRNRPLFNHHFGFTDGEQVTLAPHWIPEKLAVNDVDGSRMYVDMISDIVVAVNADGIRAWSGPTKGPKGWSYRHKVAGIVNVPSGHAAVFLGADGSSASFRLSQSASSILNLWRSAAAGTRYSTLLAIVRSGQASSDTSGEKTQPKGE